MPKDKITSSSNPKIKQLAGLREHKQRIKENLALVDGTREFQRALEAGVKVVEVYVCEELLRDETVKAFASGFKNTFYVDKKVFPKISFGDRKEGIVAVVKPQEFLLKDIKLPKNPVIVVMEKVEKPGNLGAILRTADAVGVDAVLISEAKTDIYNPNVVRSSIGTVFSLKVISSTDEKIFNYLKENNFNIYSASPLGGQEYFKSDFIGPAAIIVGSEQEGLSPFWLERANEQIRIPMRGKADSLNVSTSTAIILYEILRQRSG